MSSATVIIPARLGSTRFPAKAIAADTGRPLVQHVVDQVTKCKNVKRTIVATDDQRIVEALKPFGTHCVMTSPLHQSGTDRIAEVARGLDDQIVVNVQGDEPEIDPEVIDALAKHLETSDDEMATAATPFPEAAEPSDPNLVKVVIDERGYALYFSRAPVPYWREPVRPDDSWWTAAYHLHLGIYAYRREFLLKFASWKPTRLECAEKLEQLRVLEHGHKIYVVKVRRATHGIDTAEQYRAFVQRTSKRI